jgi:hypothetical protein
LPWDERQSAGGFHGLRERADEVQSDKLRVQLDNLSGPHGPDGHPEPRETNLSGIRRARLDSVHRRSVEPRPVFGGEDTSRFLSDHFAEG